MSDVIRWLDTVGRADIADVGGKNASLGEMLGRLAAAGVDVPGGFATTASAYRAHLAQNGLRERIAARLVGVDRGDVDALARAGADVRAWIGAQALPPFVEDAVRVAYAELCRREGRRDVAVAVRSSATAEDLPEASFAGQQETYLNVAGADALIARIVDGYASLYTDRAIAYRAHHRFRDDDVALSVGVQRMVRADTGCAGVLFTLDPESGFRDAIVINAAYGYGENVVQGTVDPDEFHLYKPAVDAGRQAVLRRRLGRKQQRLVASADPARQVEQRTVPDAERMRFCLGDGDLHALARHALAIERHYGMPMDVEWAKDGGDGRLYILQARPETVRSRENPARIERMRLTGAGPVLCSGAAVGRRIGSGRARRIASASEMTSFAVGDVLVATSTDPDWEPLMQRAAAIVTDHGGRTCHAAIVARELGVPAVVGCGDATTAIADGADVTVSCADGDEGRVHAGRLPYEREVIEPATLPPVPVQLMINIGNPDQAYELSRLPCDGVGLARLEFIIAQQIGIHPRALLDYANLPAGLRAQIDARTAGYAGPVEFYVERLAEGIATLAAAFAPRPVIVRLSDFKSNEYRSLLGGERYEPAEENPMLGFRGAARYVDPAFADCFALECRAVRRVREDMGLTNAAVMIPFVRTVGEARAVVEALQRNGLQRGAHGLRLLMMCEIPSNALSAHAFLDWFDGYSIGSNDLTQLTLGIDRDSDTVATPFDERDEAVKQLMALAIAACRARGKSVGICGQAPSDHPDLAAWLVAQGITSLSLNPDSLIATRLALGGVA